MNEKQEHIVSMFNNIAPSYDKANRLLSAGIDLKWRKEACESAFKLYDKDKIEKIVDVACGTGDLILFWKKISQKKKINVLKYIGVDPSIKMLDIAKDKIADCTFINSFADNLQTDNSSVDIISIAYGLRNVVERDKALKEFHNKLKDNGLIVILEFMKDDHKNILKPIKNFYLNKILPILGYIMSKDKKAYKYLPESIQNFVTLDELKKELIALNFKIEVEKNFSNNISSLLIARKL